MLVELLRSPLTDSRTHALRAGLLGLIVLGVRTLWWPGWPTAALMLGVLVIVPLGLALIGRSTVVGWSAFFWRAAVWLQLPAAGAVLAATLFAHPGDVPALLSLPWLMVTAMVALSGLLRLLFRGPRPVSELAVDGAMIYLAVGGVWTVLAFWGAESIQGAFLALGRLGDWQLSAARLGARALGFPDIMIQLTAVHFHFAGFVLPLLAGQVARRRPGVEAVVAVIGVLIGIPLVAVGINLTQLGNPDVEPWAAWLLAASGALVAVLHLWHARTRPPLLRALFSISGASLLAGMTLAAMYAWGRADGVSALDIPRMLPSHGAINAIGFGLFGLIAWLLDDEAVKQ